MHFLTALRNASTKMTAEFADSKLFTHSGDKGEFREDMISRFLRPFLPRCYGLGSGQVFSLNGEASRQVDVIIFDDVFSNVLFRDSTNSLFPCESVYGTIEVKSILSTEELGKAIENIASLKRLPRDETTMLDVTPIHRIKVGNGLSYSQPAISNPYIGVVFAYGGLATESVMDMLKNELAKAGTERDHLPDFIFLRQHGVTILRYRRDGNQLRVVPLGMRFDGYMAIPTAEDTLPFMFLTLNTLLNRVRLRAPDFNEYWIRMFGNQTVGIHTP